jgi:hypothetical protein
MEFTNALQIGEQTRKNIASFFTPNQELVKSITTEEFNAKYGEGHQVFTVKDLVKFSDDARAVEGADLGEVTKAIDEELSTLNAVIVNNEGKVSTLYVREEKTND